MNCKIFNSEVRGNPLLRGRGKGILIVDSEIADDVHIEGEATVVGVTLNKMMRIGTGTWTNPPRYFEINNPIAQVGITEAEFGYAYIGCRKRSIKHWLKGKDRFSRAIGWPDFMIKHIVETFELWMDTREVVNG